MFLFCPAFLHPIWTCVHILSDASANSWTLPRTKKVSTGHFFTHPPGGPSFRVPRYIKKSRYPNGYLDFLVRRKGLEPPTYWFVASHSIQLSYRRIDASLNALAYNSTWYYKMQALFWKKLKFLLNTFYRPYLLTESMIYCKMQKHR